MSDLRDQVKAAFSESFRSLSTLIHEVHRRSLWQVLGIYLLAGWITLGAVGTLVDALGLPEWTPRLALFLLIIGLPIVLATAFVQEGVGSKKASPAPADGDPAAPVPDTVNTLFTWRNALLGGVAGFAIWGVLAAAWLLLGDRLQPESAFAVEDPRRSYMVLPFDVTSDDPDLQWLADGAANLLSLGLESWREIRVANPRHMRGLAQARRVSLDESLSLDQALALSRDARTGTLIVGEVTSHAGEAQVRVWLYDVATGEVVREPIIETGSDAADLRPLFDRLTSRILEISGAVSTVSDLVGSTTSSLSSYQDYLEGIRHLYRWELAEAADRFRAAIAADSTFALAHYRLALTLDWLPGDNTAVSPIIAAARRHGIDLPWRDQQHIKGLAGLLDREYEVARAVYAELLETDSTDAEAWLQLGTVEYRDFSAAVESLDGGWIPRGNWNTALKAFARAVKIDPEFHLGYGNAFQIYQNVSGGIVYPIDVPGVSDTGGIGYGTYPTWDDSIKWLLLDFDSPGRGPRPDESWPRLFNDSIGQVVRERGIEVARRWSQAAPELAQPYEALIDLYPGLDGLTPDRAVASADAAQKSLELVGDTTLDQLYRLAAFKLVAGKLDSATFLLQQAQIAERENRYPLEGIVAKDGSPGTATKIRWRQKAFWTVPHNLFLSLGQVEKAIDVRQRKAEPREIPSYEGANKFDYSVHDSIAWRLEALGATGAPRQVLQESMDRLIASFAVDSLPQADGNYLLDEYTDEASPSLAALGSTAIERWTRLVGKMSPEWQVLQLAYDGSDDQASADLSIVADALDRPDVPAVRIFVLGLAAQVLGQDSLAVEIFERMSTVQYYYADPQAGFALRSRAYIGMARLNEALGNIPEARANYETFVEIWKDAEPCCQAELEEAQRALVRLGEQ